MEPLKEHSKENWGPLGLVKVPGFLLGGGVPGTLDKGGWRRAGTRSFQKHVIEEYILHCNMVHGISAA